MTTSGKQTSTSTVRMTSSSSQPPRRAASAPRITPETAQMTSVIPAMVTENRPPHISLESTSRPRWSVPSQ